MQLASSEILIQSLWEWWEASASLTRRGPYLGFVATSVDSQMGERNGQCPGTLAGRGERSTTCPSQGFIYIYINTHTHPTLPLLLCYRGPRSSPTSKLPRLSRFDSCKLNPAWGLLPRKGRKGELRRISLETRPPAERLDEINI